MVSRQWLCLEPGAVDVGVLAFIAAEARELDGLLARVSRVAKLEGAPFGRTFEFHGRAAVAVANGPGPLLASRALELVKGRFDLDAIISVGYCGALEDELAANDIVVGAAVNGVEAREPAIDRGYIAGPVFSSDRVIATAEEKRVLRRTGAIAAEMEAAALAERARAWGIPFYCVRVVTDTAAESLPLDFNCYRARDGRFSRSRILLAALRRPGTLVPALRRLDQRCKTASEALGDFVADCRF